ncbi:MAG TPA: hypothetical protein VG389_25005 [Myxococcota bacterium]|jgi:hypothetical protein|nr:hypothetical protein [Myxococcota bacterium]
MTVFRVATTGASALWLGLGAALAGGCLCNGGIANRGDAAPDDGGSPACNAPDADGDGIADGIEGAPDRDSDGDGTPDFQDADSDGDGIPDAVESQTGGDACAAPASSDGDGDPDYVDTDSDGNGVSDTVEAGADPAAPVDTDGDGTPDYAETDNDGDGIADVDELRGNTLTPPDADGDGAADWVDTDSDNDGVPDAIELAGDPDGDGVASYLDDDSDGDGLSDTAEAGPTPSSPVDTDGDGVPDFLDVDSDNDGVTDADEVGVYGTDPTAPDTDGDGVTDLVETAAGTDATDPTDNPQANGDFVFVVPYMDPPDPTSDDLDFSTDIQIADVYLLVDRSGSMSGELTSIASNIQTVLNDLTCPPLGTGTPGSCIADLWSGAGSFTYSGYQPYQNHLDVQPDPALVGPAIPAYYAGATGCCAEPHLAALWSTCSGLGSAATGCAGLASYPDRASCAGSMAGASGIGYPCFRPSALPIILLATDEPPSTQYVCPGFASAAAEATAIGAKVIGLRGATTDATVTADLETIATDTGAVDGAGNPLVFDGADAAAGPVIETAISTLVSSVPLDLSALAVDDPADAIDAVAAFVDYLVTLQTGVAPCTAGLTETDSDGNGFPDEYVDVTPGTSVCWSVVPKVNTTVMPTSEPQLFRATVEVWGDSVTLLDSRDVFFLVPPNIVQPPIG